MQELGLMERFIDPALIGDLTLADKAIAGLITTLMGMGTTFAVLAMLWLVIFLISIVIRRSEGRIRPAAEDIPADTIMEDRELVAVITAAIIAGQGIDVFSDIKIKKIRRVSGTQDLWNAAGNAETIENRKF